MVGSRIREARTSRSLSLNDVAERAHISVATLSRIERDKQGIDLGLFLILCRILKTEPRDMIGSEDSASNIDPLAQRIGRLRHGDRVQLWRDLADARRSEKRQTNRANARRLSDEVEELLAQLQYVQAEIEAVHARTRKR
ncbi:MAG TPA: helix-turn-helix transcriptional regulator [Thermoanaerobaculia bacterium]